MQRPGSERRQRCSGYARLAHVPHRRREREAKFEVADDFDLPFSGPLGGRSSVKLSATYWDTTDRRLLRWGQTLRHRYASDGSEDGWTLKIGTPPGVPGDGVLDRWELDEPGPPDEPPARLAGLVLGIVRGAPLEPVAAIETEREKRLIGAVEVSDDRVSSSIDGTAGPSFRQIELEVKGSGAGPLLRELSDRLIRAGAKPTTASKLETALGGQPEPEVAVPRLRPRSHLDTLVGYALSRSVIRLIGEDPKIRASSDADPVHDARVATRRLRSDLKTLEPYLSPVEGLRTELGWLGGLLGEVRDLDVLIERMRAQIAELPDADQAAAAAILGRLDDDRHRRRGELLDGLGEVQDTVVAEERLRALRLSSGSAFVAGMLACGERAARADARDRWPRLWKAARAKRSRRWFS